MSLRYNSLPFLSGRRPWPVGSKMHGKGSWSIDSLPKYGCAEGLGPFAGSLRVSLRYNSLFLPFREETLARR